MLEYLKHYEDIIANVNNKEDMKKIVRKLFKDDNVNDIDFADIIYENVIPKLKKLGVVFDRENEIDYEIVLKEEY